VRELYSLSRRAWSSSGVAVGVHTLTPPEALPAINLSNNYGY